MTSGDPRRGLRIRHALALGISRDAWLPFRRLPRVMKRAPRGLTAVALLVGLVALWVSRARAPERPIEEVHKGSGCALFGHAERREDRPAESDASRLSSPSLPPVTADKLGDRTVREATRMRLLEAMTLSKRDGGGDAQSGQSGQSGTTRGAEWYAQPGNLDASYIQSRIRDLFWPEVRSCFAAARARSPKLAGTLAIRFVIVGDEHVGGIVESADVDPQRTTLSDSALGDCVAQSMLAMTFRAPESGGSVTVIYPFVLGDETLERESKR
jgi:hypothetical protein